MTDEDDIQAIQKILKESTGINFKMPTKIIHPEPLLIYYGQRDFGYKVLVGNCPICLGEHIYNEKSTNMIVKCPKRHEIFRLIIKGLD